MRTIKRMRTKMISLTLVLAMLLPMCWTNKASSVSAASSKDTFVMNEISEEQKVEISNYKADIEEFVQPIFGDRGIKTCEYLYNLDDSSDYIYVEFETGGYVVYAKETMEMMEYSLQGTLPYTSTAKKYYAGPTKYFHKSSNQFHDVISGEKIVIAEKEIKEVAQNIRNITVNSDVAKYDVQATNSFQGEYAGSGEKNTIATRSSSSPDLNDNELIIASKTSGTLIANYTYFVKNPTIGANDGTMCGNGNTGTCGPVAAQLLLGYHNYYSDRRIIPDRFLNGYDDETGRVIRTYENPNYCTNPMLMTSATLGTRSESFEGENNNSFYIQMVTRIMAPAGFYSTQLQVKNGIQSYLSTRLSTSGYSVAYQVTDLGIGVIPIDSTTIKSEINAGRPIIISLGGVLSGNEIKDNHYVVGYGYQNYTYPSGGGTYEGYVVHFGWIGDVCVWINSAWCHGYVSLNINHTHQYQEFKTISTGSGIESRCTICGHRTDAIVNISSNAVYKELRVTLAQSEYKEYRITFQTAGNWLFQTFGNNDTFLYLYDTQYNQLVAVDDNGYNYNAYFNYNVQAGTTYILRVKFWSRSTVGDIKVGITAAPAASSTYANLVGAYGTNEQYTFSVLQNKAQVCTFTPSESGLYEFEYSFAIPNEGYIRLYVIDPASTAKCSWSNDGSFVNTITTNLTVGIPYYIVIGDGATMSGEVVCLSVDKIQ